MIRFEKATLQEFDLKMRALKKLLEGFKNSFNYIQDYVNIYGLKIWQEEFQRIVNYNVEQECNKFLKQVHEVRLLIILAALSCKLKRLLSERPLEVPVQGHPHPRPGEDQGRSLRQLHWPFGFALHQTLISCCCSLIAFRYLGRALLTHTDVRKTVYLHKMSAWYLRDETEAVSLRTFDMLIDSLGVFGVAGLDRFYGFSIVKDLQVWTGNLGIVRAHAMLLLMDCT